MLLSVDLTTPKPIYTQLYEQLLNGIATGELVSGEALPAIRQLAAELEINMHTANKAYAELESEGFVVSHKREGFVVNTREAMKASSQHIEAIHERLRSVASESACRGISEKDFIELCRKAYEGFKIGSRKNGN